MSRSSPEPGQLYPSSGSRLRWLTVLAFGALLSLSGLKRFEPWEQVLDLWEANVSPLVLAVTGHPHFFRFLTAYPGFLLEESYPDLGFSLFISLFMACNAVLWRKLSFFARGEGPGSMAWTVFFAAHVFMNGRGVIAWTAWLICAGLCLRQARGASWDLRSLLLAFLSCWLAAVSTGVFIVVVAAFVLFQLQFRRKRRMHPARKLVLLAFAAPALFYVGQYLLLSVQKNVEFFGGGLTGVYHMLAHGLGRVLFGSELLAIVIVAGAAFALLFLWVLIKLRGTPFSPMEQLLAFTAFGGLFGLTVFTLAVPIGLVFSGSRHSWDRFRGQQPGGASTSRSLGVAAST